MACNECSVEAGLNGKRVLVTIRRENTDVLGTRPDTWGTLYRCRTCGTYWELERSFRELTAEEARQRFPDLVPRLFTVPRGDR